MVLIYKYNACIKWRETDKTNKLTNKASNNEEAKNNYGCILLEQSN